MSSASLGAIFHYNPNPLEYWVRHQAELTVTQTADAQARNAVDVRQNFVMGYGNYVISALEHWGLNSGAGFSKTGKFSVGYIEKDFDGYVQADVANHIDFTSLAVGGSYRATPQLRLLAQASQNIASREAKPDLAVGAEYTPFLRGFGIKLGYFHEKKIASVLSFGLNRYFTGSLLFDVSKV